MAPAGVRAKPVDYHSTIGGAHSERPIRSESRARLVEGIARGRYWLSQLMSGQVSDTTEIAEREACSDRSVRMTVSLAFVSPVIVQAAIEGTLPRNLGVAALVGLPADWERQAEVVLLQQPSGP